MRGSIYLFEPLIRALPNYIPSIQIGAASLRYCSEVALL